MAFSGQGAATGAMAGAGLGLQLGGPWGALAGGIAGAGTGFLYPGQKDDGSGMDISAELAKIDALYERARASGEAQIKRNAADQKITANSNLAARGTYRSPVAENVFGQIRRSEMDQYGQLAGDIAAKQATARATLLGALMGKNFDAKQGALLRSQQNSAGISGALGTFGLNLLLKNLMSGDGPTPAGGAGNSWANSGMNPGNQGGSYFGNYGSNPGGSFYDPVSGNMMRGGGSIYNYGPTTPSPQDWTRIPQSSYGAIP